MTVWKFGQKYVDTYVDVVDLTHSRCSKQKVYMVIF